MKLFGGLQEEDVLGFTSPNPLLLKEGASCLLPTSSIVRKHPSTYDVFSHEEESSRQQKAHSCEEEGGALIAPSFRRRGLGRSLMLRISLRGRYLHWQQCDNAGVGEGEDGQLENRVNRIIAKIVVQTKRGGCTRPHAWRTITQVVLPHNEEETASGTFLSGERAR